LDDVIVSVECNYCWYWLENLCASPVRFVLGHASYIKAIHCGKTKKRQDRLAQNGLAAQDGNFPMAYTAPSKWRVTRDLQRRRKNISGTAASRAPYQYHQHSVKPAGIYKEAE
jgi:hypothetical protein